MADNREDQDLSISSVLSGKVTPSEKILYASRIDHSKVRDSIQALKEDATSQIDKTNELISNVRNTLSSTNSKRLYSGEEAQFHLNDINKTETDLEELKNYLNNIDEDDISFVTSKYNTELNKLKKGAKLKLLKYKADEWNAGKHVDRVEEHSYKLNGEEINQIPEDGESYHEKGFLQFEIKTVAHSQYSITKRFIHYKYINYWKWFTGDSFPFNILDDNEASLEAKFIEYGIPLPYDPSKIIDYD